MVCGRDRPYKEASIIKLFERTQISLVSGSDRVKVLLNGEDVTDAVRELAVSENVSLVAQHPKVREHLLTLQRQLAADGGVVRMDGILVLWCYLMLG